MLRKGNLITLKDHYHRRPHPKDVMLLLTDKEDLFRTDAAAYVKALDKNGTIFNIPYSQLYMYEAIA